MREYVRNIAEPENIIGNRHFYGMDITISHELLHMVLMSAIFIFFHFNSR